MSNARILGHSWGDDGTVTATTAALPAANMQHRSPSRAWRSTGTGAQVLTFPFGQDRPVSMLHIENLNSTSVLVELLNSSGGALYVANVDPWTQTLTFRALTHYFDVAGGGNRVTDNGDTRVTDNGDIRVLFENVITGGVVENARTLRLTLTGTPDAYHEAGRVKVGKSITAEKTINFGARVGYMERGELAMSRGGTLRAEPKTPVRRVQASWEWLEDAEAFEFAELLREIGQRDDVVFAGFPDDTDTNSRLYTILGRLTERDMIDRHGVAGWASGSPVHRSRLGITIQESL